jgi:hypothetical protein
MRWEHAFKLSVNWNYSNKYIKIQLSNKFRSVSHFPVMHQLSQLVITTSQVSFEWQKAFT